MTLAVLSQDRLEMKHFNAAKLVTKCVMTGLEKEFDTVRALFQAKCEIEFIVSGLGVDRTINDMVGLFTACCWGG